MQHELNTGDQQLTNLLKYVDHCRQVYQGLKNIAHIIAAVKCAKEKRASNTPAVKKVAMSLSITTTQTPSFLAKPSCQLTIGKRD